MDVKVLGCANLVTNLMSPRFTITASTTTTTITSTLASTTRSTTPRLTPPSRRFPPVNLPKRRRPHRPQLPRTTTVESSTVEVTTSTAGINSNVTTATPPDTAFFLGMSRDVVITLGVLIPTMTAIGFTGCYLYVQYRKRRGLSYGCIPCGGKRGEKLKSSDENVNASVNQPVPPAPAQVQELEPDNGAAAAAAALGPAVAKLADRIDNIGVGAASLDGMEETELYSAPPNSASVLPAEPRPEPIPQGQQKPPIPARSREYHSRKCKENKDMFEFDQAQTEEMARKKGE